MDAADRDESAAEEPTPAEVAAALKALRERRDEVRKQAEMLAAEGLSQMVVGETEARLMRTARHGPQVAYNVQTAVDAKYGLIVVFEVTNGGNDQQQLAPMAKQAQCACAPRGAEGSPSMRACLLTARLSREFSHSLFRGDDESRAGITATLELFTPSA